MTRRELRKKLRALEEKHGFQGQPVFMYELEEVYLQGAFTLEFLKELVALLEGAKNESSGETR